MTLPGYDAWKTRSDLDDTPDWDEPDQADDGEEDAFYTAYQDAFVAWCDEVAAIEPEVPQ